ncbi:MAG: hypothetical protein US94_C0037G0011 [Berkelbacteria bacterium GW2011_GWB1_38_5]|uniref:Transmembrane protein (PGPGW) n=1 Tax=Berkelbacteria bacterium GW2011_GWB1_38_5 TaxID=1618336 RepID=A0A0G0K317_9BACT|nr:MAG: hypothetical protein US94_C0037G0011 [Berkelbacteria bacterium GW2011_GWB1_38_5]
MKIIFHYFLIFGGLFLILLGIAGLFLPIIPGIIFIILGLIVMGKKDIVEHWFSKLPEPFSAPLLKLIHDKRRV